MEQHSFDKSEQRPTQHWISKCPDLDEVSEVITKLNDRKSPGLDGLHLKERGLEAFLGTLYHHDPLRKTSKSLKAERMTYLLPSSRRETNEIAGTSVRSCFFLYQGKCSSLYCWTDYQPRSTMRVLRKRRNHRHDLLLATTTGKMHWTQPSIHAICQLHKSLRYNK